MSAIFFVIVSMQKEKEKSGLVFFQIATTTKKLVLIIWFLVNENLQNLGVYW